MIFNTGTFRPVVSSAALAMLWATAAQATTFTGPVSPYYLDNWYYQTIYVVQGTSVINSFPWSYETGNAAARNEGNLAISHGYVTTNGQGSDYGAPATAGQYTLGGTPTGLGHTAQPTPGLLNETQLDGTSDGLHNYTVDYYAVQSGVTVEPVIQTNLSWQKPAILFTPPSTLGVLTGITWAGITYDPLNDSLWLSNWSTTPAAGYGIIADFSLSGTLLSYFYTGTGVYTMSALAMDYADGTLWVNVADTDDLFQYSTSGTLLQSGTPTGLPPFEYSAGAFALPVPEPASSLALLAVALTGLGVLRRRARV
jgi:hypothetical protein